MAIEAKIYALLTANATIAAKAGARVYPIVMPQNPTFPSITYQRVSGNKINSLAGYSKLENVRISINIWGKQYDDAKGLAGDIHSAMDNSTGFKSILTNDLDGYDPDTGLYFVAQDFSCWDKTT